jgi:hypothetical protein
VDLGLGLRLRERERILSTRGREPRDTLWPLAGSCHRCARPIKCAESEPTLRAELVAQARYCVRGEPGTSTTWTGLDRPTVLVTYEHL